MNPEDTNTLSTYLVEINRTPLLSAEEEVNLSMEMRAGGPKGEEARKHFIEANLRFVVKLAKAFVNQGLSLSDLIQEGNIGLIEAVERFDPTMGFRFTTFGAYWIRQAMQRAIAKKARQIRLPVRKHRALAQMEYLRAQYYITHGAYPDLNELSKMMNLSVKTIKSLEESRETPVSLESPVGDDKNMELANILEDHESHSPRDVALDDQMKEKIEKVLSFLTERERKILLLRYGFSDGDDISLRCISKKVGLSQEGVRRIEKEALNKLRRPAVRVYLEGFIDTEKKTNDI